MTVARTATGVQLGLNQDTLSYLYQGRRERLTQIHGNVISEIV